MKKIVSIALAVCFVFTSASAFAAHPPGHPAKHKVHTKTHKIHTKAKTTKKLHIKEAPGMPSTGLGGTSN
ncbi:hypothetical protein [Brevibacillus massiliensis]|uniref:hypothetical protein n=1 Tax=Brevibacillus massiliensis TaxID=1118054 RepID=UPI0002DB6DA4|nr:hypothetical protein [Brevibacillus massiliensis]